MAEICRLETPEAIAAEAASRAAQALAEAQKAYQLVTFVLAGGRLPPRAYEILSVQYAKAFNWSRVLFLIGDERCVPFDDPNSSWLGALSMFDLHPEVPAQHKLRPRSNLSAEQAASTYTKTLHSLPHNQTGRPMLNHVWLGAGEDGHTLSLFPGHPSSTEKTEQLVIPIHDAPKPPPDRISLTYHALEGTQSAIIFVSGSSKASMLARIADGDLSLPVVVASRAIEKTGGHVTWLLDNESMSQIPVGRSLNLA